MRSDQDSIDRRALWICPECGARLVSRNLWHSCGRFTLEALFAKSGPGVTSLARACVSVLRSLGDVQIIPQKMRLVCVTRVRFAGLYPHRDRVTVAFALRRRLRSRRIVKTTNYGPRWQGHFIDILARGDIDDELRAWLQESHDTVGVQRDLSPTRRSRNVRPK